jgi:hypothetical protein
MTVTYVESSVLVPAGSRTSVAIPVPTGVASGDIVTVGVYKENTAAITAPSGFTLKTSDTTNATTQGALWVYWKRLTASDSGTYTFSWTGSSFAGGQAIAARGAISTGDPFQGTVSIVRTANNSGATISTSADSILNGFGISFVSSWATATRTWTAPSGWLREEQTVNMMTGRQDTTVATTTGTVTWTGNGNDYYQMFLGVLKPVPPVGTTAYVIKSGVKKAATLYVIKSGVKKAALPYVVDSGVKK